MQTSKELLIVSCTRATTDEEFEQRPLFSSIKKLKDLYQNLIKVKVFRNEASARGLSVCYNEILKDPNNIDKTVLFVHDDVIIEDLFLYEKLMFNNPYSIVGLAGSRCFDPNSEHLTWHLSSLRKDHLGEVSHCSFDSQGQPKVWTSVFGPTQGRALLVDGLFICCKIKNVVESKLEFDEQFKFHFYDLAFCLRANSLRVQCGVLPIRVVHYGLGDSVYSEEWKDSCVKFKKTYCV